ncbi:hypothetical protein D3C72_990540 [compost metagenome]
MVRVTKSELLPDSSSLVAPNLLWCAWACMAWLARCENGSRAPCVLISCSTCSSELAFQNLFRKSAERLRMLTLLAALTRIRYQVTSDIRIRMTNRLLPTKSLWATKCRKPMSGVATGAGAGSDGSVAAALCSASADC